MPQGRIATLRVRIGSGVFPLHVSASATVLTASGKRMQQVSLAKKDSTDGTRAPALAAIAPRKAFVINLSASTTPVALTPPDHAGLKRFTFFVSRRREEGRERFRLHMGYFDTQEEAEKLLDIVREIYPGAWAGLSPGQRLRGGSAEEAAPEAAAPAPAPAAVVAVAAAPPPAPAAQSLSDAPAPIMSASPAAPVPQSDAVIGIADTSTLALLPDEGRRLPEKPVVETAARYSGIDSKDEAAASALNNVRSAIASLDDTSSAPTLRSIPQLQPVPRAVAASISPPTLSAPVLKSVSAPRAPATPVNSAAARPVVATDAGAPLNDHDALKVLEGRAQPAATPLHSTSASATMPMPHLQSPQSEDSSSRPDRTYFAVQLMWSVQPIDVAQVPQLAIFSAYTVYGAEGNRDGRRWYGLRLGFFTDAVSAKQVAHYVRSEFSTVSVVPVTVRERERARLAVARPASAVVTAKPATPAKPEGNNFEFIEDKAPAPAPAASGKSAAGRAAGAPRTGRNPPGKRAKLRNAPKVAAKSKSMTLEETLEILGAGQLQIDTDRTTVNDSGVRHLRLEAVKSKPSKLGRLFERLAERMGN